ncbi:glycerophosphoryl diester phosphodiesterase [Marivirga lumbricoides]|uniref:Glycerophosphoryl diester phosphodiesterase n=1 Tax=Marivirga lumbricoides TaxID=1046115 RepID=A0ABQ1N5J9_9BACT|nr:glycerophosphoryl diester phosphodiesterase [Marivirga lumbricoides]
MKKYFYFSLIILWLVGCNNPTSNKVKEMGKSSEAESQNDSLATFNAWLNDSQPLISAHRGGPYPGFPENAIETFQYISGQIPKLIIECDVSMTSDSMLVLMHDRTLDRTTTGSGNLSDFTLSELLKFKLVDNEGKQTPYQIPTLDQALAWGKGKVLYTLDVKRGVPYDKVLKVIKKYEAETYAAIITYRIQDAELVHSLNPDVIISVSAGDDGALKQIRKSGIPFSQLLGFVGTKEPGKDHYQKLQKLEITAILGTLGNLDKSAKAKRNDAVYVTYVNNGANIIATDRPLEVSNILYQKHAN